LACHESISIKFRVVILDLVEGANGVAHIAELDVIVVNKQVVLVSVHGHDLDNLCAVDGQIFARAADAV
jgi:hypothetical protein